MNKCNENWHEFNNNSEACQCGKIKDFEKYIDGIISKTRKKTNKILNTIEGDKNVK